MVARLHDPICAFESINPAVTLIMQWLMPLLFKGSLSCMPRFIFSSRTLFLLLLCLALASCDNAEDETEQTDFDATPTEEQLAKFEANTTLTSDFGTPKADGTFNASLRTIFKGKFQNDAGNEYAFELGREGTAFSAVGGILEETDLGALPPTGFAAMSGPYEIHEAGKSDGVSREYGDVQSTRGRITLRADFTFGTLQGTDEVLTIDGTFSDKMVTGSAFFNKRAAALKGQVGASSAVGVFHGADDATAFVGGFLVER